MTSTFPHLTLPHSLSRAITYSAARHKFQCGKNFYNLTVVNFSGPDGAKACAYSCNMNLDADGEPQAYGPLSKPKTREFLGNACWKTTAQNDALKKEWEDAVKALDELEKKKTELVTKLNAAEKPGAAALAPATTQTPPAANPPPAKPATATAPAAKKPISSPELAALDDKIRKAKKKLEQYYWDEDAKKRPKNYGTIFWRWCGVKSLDPDRAKKEVYFEIVGVGEKQVKIRRQPDLGDKDPIYEDVDGTFPVVQSQYEPGPGFFVSQMPHTRNPRFPEWDQRYFLPEGATIQGPYAALANGLDQETGVHLQDVVFAIRLDTGQSLMFPFRDSGNGYKVGECSIDAFASLGGVLAEKIDKSDNSFRLLYLAFPGKQTLEAALAKFASAANSDIFPIILSFIAQATIETRIGGSVSTDPVQAFERWKKSGSTAMPSAYNLIDTALSQAGFNPTAQRFLKTHPSTTAVGGSGSWLKLNR